MASGGLLALTWEWFAALPLLLRLLFGGGGLLISIPVVGHSVNYFLHSDPLISLDLSSPVPATATSQTPLEDIEVMGGATVGTGTDPNNGRFLNIGGLEIVKHSDQVRSLKFKFFIGFLDEIAKEVGQPGQWAEDQPERLNDPRRLEANIAHNLKSQGTTTVNLWFWVPSWGVFEKYQIVQVMDDTKSYLEIYDNMTKEKKKVSVHDLRSDTGDFNPWA